MQGFYQWGKTVLQCWITLYFWQPKNPIPIASKGFEIMLYAVWWEDFVLLFGQEMARWGQGVCRFSESTSKWSAVVGFMTGFHSFVLLDRKKGNARQRQLAGFFWSEWDAKAKLCLVHGESCKWEGVLGLLVKLCYLFLTGNQMPMSEGFLAIVLSAAVAVWQKIMGQKKSAMGQYKHGCGSMVQTCPFSNS